MASVLMAIIIGLLINTVKLWGRLNKALDKIDMLEEELKLYSMMATKRQYPELVRRSNSNVVGEWGSKK